MNIIDVCGVCGERIRYRAGHWVHDEADYDPFDDPHTPVVAEWDTHEPDED
jgi:hypothetical protein